MLRNLSLHEIFNRETPFESLLPNSGVVLVGRANIGPVMTPIKARDITSVQNIFGDSQLTNSYIECSNAGAKDIYLVRINGAHAITDIQGMITLMSLSGETSANDLQYKVVTEVTEGGSFTWLLLKNDTTFFTKTYDITFMKIEDIVTMINLDAIAFESPVFAIMNIEDTLVDIDYTEGQSINGDSGAGNNNYCDKLRDLLSFLMSYPISQLGIVYESFDYFDTDKSVYLYNILSLFARDKMRACEPCIVTIGAAEWTIESDDFFDSCFGFTGIIASQCEVSEFINVIIANLKTKRFDNTLGEYIYLYQSNAVAAYCGLIDSLSPDAGTTNRQVEGLEGLYDRLNLTEVQKRALSNFGFVILRYDRYGGIKQFRVMRGANLTCSSNYVLNPDFDGSLDESDTNQRVSRVIPTALSSLSNVKLMQYIGMQLKDVIDNYDSDEDSDISTLKVKIVNALSAVEDYIKEYAISIEEVLQGFSKTQMVYLDIIPMGEIRSVTISAQIQ